MTDAAEAVAKAVLYEGYVLYPYHSGSRKNRYRFQFGGLYPRAYVAANPGADRSDAAAELLVQGPATARLTVSLRGLQVLSADPSRDEAEERRLDSEPVTLEDLSREARETTVRYGEGETGILARMAWSAEKAGTDLFRVRVRASNETKAADTARENVLRRTLFSAHFLCRAEGARFVSQIDPPAELAAEAERNLNSGLYPVLVGDESTRDRILAAPIILYDFPKIAPESRGDLYDGLEIDEILSLRIRTLTDEEKEAIRSSGPRVAALLDRTENLTQEELLGLHGAVRDAGAGFRPGDRVRLRPMGSDIFDIALVGKSAVVEKVERTLEDACLVAVTIEDDPGRDFGELGLPGHRFFFRPEELERLCG